MPVASLGGDSTPHPRPLPVRGEEGELFCGTFTQGSSYVVQATLGYFLLPVGASQFGFALISGMDSLAPAARP